MREPTTWLVTVTAGGGTEYSDYRNGKDAHRAASYRSRAPGTDHATVTFNGCVTTYRDGIGTGPGREAGQDMAGSRPIEPVDAELYRRTAPAWNCVSFPGDGMHYTPGSGRCEWCGMTAAQIAEERRARGDG